METLFTVEEYRSRIINTAIRVAKQSIKKNANPIIKKIFIEQIVKECITWHIMLKDEYNALFFEVFAYDRQGNRLGNHINFSEKECEEFNNQKWYLDYKAEHKYNYYEFKNHYICNGEKELIYYNDAEIMNAIVQPFNNISDIVNEVLKLF